MILIDCNYFEMCDLGLKLSDLASIAQVIIAIANICLAIYIFTYQRSKDQKTQNDTARLNEQNIKLQWFKELVIQPNFDVINKFYDDLNSIEGQIGSNDLNDEEKEKINDFIKASQSRLRKSLVDVLLFVDPQFANKAKENLDKLVDGITEAIFNDELKLKNPNTYEKYIASKISASKNNLIAQLYNYKGLSS